MGALDRDVDHWKGKHEELLRSFDACKHDHIQARDMLRRELSEVCAERDALRVANGQLRERLNELDNG